MDWKRAAGSLAAAVLAVTVPATTVAYGANGPKTIGTVHNVTYGIPVSIHRGTTISLHTWYRQTSKDTLITDGFALTIWGPRTGGGYAYVTRHDITMQWLDPVTRKWRTAPQSAPNTFQYDIPSSETVKAAPNRWVRTDFRITFTKAVPAGRWHFTPLVPTSYELRNSKGYDDFATVNVDQHDYSLNVRR